MPHKDTRLPNILIIILDICILIAIFAIPISTSFKTSVLKIFTIPSDAIIYINGSKYTSGTYSFYPGNITAKIEKDGFDTKETIMTLEANTYSRLFVYLTKDGELSYIDASHYNDLYRMSNLLQDEQLTTFIKNYEDEQNLKNFLPIFYDDADKNILLNISYETDLCKEKNYCILINDPSGKNYNLAISLLKKYHYESPNYEIIYQHK